MNMAAGRRKKKVAYRRRHQNRFSMFLVMIVVVMILVVVAVKRVELSRKAENYQARIEQLNEQIAQEEARAEEIALYEKRTHTKEFYIEVAHNKLGLVFEDEIIFKEE